MLKTYERPFIFISTFLILLYLKWPILNMPYHWDALAIMEEVNKVSNHHCFNNRPPLLFELCRFMIRAFRDPIWPVRLFNVFVASASVYTAYAIGRYLYDRKTGFFSAVLLLSCPLFFAQSGIVNFEILLTFLTLISVYFALKDDIKKYLFFSSLLVLAKETGFLIVIAVLLYQLYRACFRKEISIRRSLMYGASLAVLLLFLILTDFRFILWYKPLLLDTTNWLVMKRNAKYVFGELFYYDYRWILTSFLTASFVMNRRGYRDKRLVLIILSAVVYFIFFIIANRHLQRYLLPIYPLFFMLSANALIVVLDRRKALSYIALVLFILLSVSQYDRHRTVETNTGAGAVLESNMEYLDVVRTHQEAAKYIEENFPDATVLTTWPQHAELTHPYLGYITKPIKTKIVYSDDYKGIEGIDLIYYSPQAHEHNLLRKEIESVETVLLKKYERNNKYTAIYKVIKK